MDGARILYIEDNVENRTLVKRVLEAENYVVLEADNGVDGLRVAREKAPDLILIDINLPEVDGYEVTTRLRQMEGLSNIPIVALTANVLKGDRERSLEAGCDGYIQKPIDVDLLPAQGRCGGFNSHQVHYGSKTKNGWEAPPECPLHDVYDPSVAGQRERPIQGEG